MNEVVNTGGLPTTLYFRIATRGQQVIRFVAFDYYDKKKIYCNRYMPINAEGVVYIRLPYTPERMVFRVYNDKTGNLANFQIVEKRQMPFKSKMKISDYSKETAEFLNLAIWMSVHLKDLSGGGSSYMSKKANYRIDVYDWITSDGVKLNTPARITKEEGIMELSQGRLIDFTVFEILAVELHEFAHFNLNKVMEDESEADINALKIYFDLGCPVIDAATVFLKVFKHSDTEENMDRLVKIENFINNYTRQYKYQFEN
ncbi:MAG: hypothetical protein WCT77_00195 [Bacteroidota bacterium]